MQSNHFSRNFIRQFLPDTPVLRAPVKTLLTSSASLRFAWIKNRRVLSEATVVDSLSDTPLIRKLINKVTREDIVAADKLQACIQTVGRIFKSYADNEPATAGYFYSLLGGLKIFHSLVLSFQQKVQKDLLKRLNEMMLAKKKGRNVVYFQQSQIEAVLKDIPPFVHQLLRYESHYRTILKNESGNQQGISVTTHAEQYLLQLTGHIEDLLSATESTQADLWQWQSFLDKLEWQEVYN